MEQKKATFQLVEYCFPAFSFNTIDSQSQGDKEGAIQLGLTAQGLYSQESRRFNIKIEMQILASKELMCQIQCLAAFEFVNEIKKEDIPDYFYANSIAILYPYIRAFCSLITTQSNNPGVILPVLNLTALGEELKQNTTLQENNDTNNSVISSGSL